MIRAEIIIRDNGKEIARSIVTLSPMAANHQMSIPLQPTVIQKAEYSHDDQLTLLGLNVTLQSVIASSKHGNDFMTEKLRQLEQEINND